LYIISFASLTPLIEKYGRSSAEFIGAIYLLDHSIPKILLSFNNLYSGRMVTEIILLGAHPSVRQSVDTRSIFSHLNRLLPNKRDITLYYPSLYINTESSRLDDICHVLSIELHHYDFQVYCPAVADSNTYANTMLLATDLSNVRLQGYTNYSSNNDTMTVQHYQLRMWISILMVLFTLAAVYSLAFMTFKKDTLLYSTFNPNWEDRSRR